MTVIPSRGPGNVTQGPPGEPGVTPHIGGNGNWFIGTTDTGVAARGPQGEAGADGTGGGVLDPDLYPTLAEVATVEDLTLRVRVETVVYASNVAVVSLGPVYTLSRVVAAALTSEALTLGTSSSNYHIVELVKWPEAGFAGSTPAPVMIATKTFQPGADQMVPLYAWHFGSIILDPVAQILQPMDVLGFRITKIGTPSSMTRMSFVARIEPKRDGA